VGSCECGGEPSGSGTTELVGWLFFYFLNLFVMYYFFCNFSMCDTENVRSNK
jgi:hypothetical protein